MPENSARAAKPAARFLFSRGSSQIAPTAASRPSPYAQGRQAKRTPAHMPTPKAAAKTAKGR